MEYLSRFLQYVVGRLGGSKLHPTIDHVHDLEEPIAVFWGTKKIQREHFATCTKKNITSFVAF